VIIYAYPQDFYAGLELLSYV